MTILMMMATTWKTKGSVKYVFAALHPIMTASPGNLSRLASRKRRSITTSLLMRPRSRASLWLVLRNPSNARRCSNSLYNRHPSLRSLRRRNLLSERRNRSSRNPLRLRRSLNLSRSLNLRPHRHLKNRA